MGVGELEIIAPLILGVLLIITIGGVILLKPISNKLGHLLEAMAKERQLPRTGEELGHIRELLETMDGRLSLLEERQDFTDALLADPDRQANRLRASSSERPVQE